MRTPLLRLLLAGTAVAAAVAVPAAPASAAGCVRIVWTEHKLYDGPPGQDIWVLLPTVVFDAC